LTGEAFADREAVRARKVFDFRQKPEGEVVGFGDGNGVGWLGAFIFGNLRSIDLQMPSLLKTGRAALAFWADLQSARRFPTCPTIPYSHA